MANSIEEKVEGYYKNLFKCSRRTTLCKRRKKLTVNPWRHENYKGGGSGMNYPDIKLLARKLNRRGYSSMIEVKGSRGKRKLQKR